MWSTNCDGLLIDRAGGATRKNFKRVTSGGNEERDSSLAPSNTEGGESSVRKSACCDRWRGANLFPVRETPKCTFLLLSLTELHNSARVNLCHTHLQVMAM